MQILTAFALLIPAFSLLYTPQPVSYTHLVRPVERFLGHGGHRAAVRAGDGIVPLEHIALHMPAVEAVSYTHLIKNNFSAVYAQSVSGGRFKSFSHHKEHNGIGWRTTRCV